MEVFEPLIVFIELVLSEIDVNSSVKEYFLMNVYWHFFIISLDERNNFVQCLLIFDVLENFRNEKVKNLI